MSARIKTGCGDVLSNKIFFNVFNVNCNCNRRVKKQIDFPQLVILNKEGKIRIRIEKGLDFKR
ncbi:hypothetical protein AGMMS49573_09700 [Endomicrobiia bacterium]|nr:hypothetical protein AGMMS49573_09700 [Endomicrobiia bacterium]